MSWEKIKVNEFCYVTDFVANGSFASLKENVTYIHKEDYARLIRITDGTKKWVGEFIWVNKSSFDFLKKSQIFPGDLIMANVGEPGKTFIIPDLGSPMTLGPNSILIRPNNKIANTKFLYYYFNSANGKAAINSITSATTQSKFNKGSFRNLDIPLPPLETQKRIADILDAADALRQKDQESLKKYDELAQAIFIEMFGDPVKNEKGWLVKAIKETTDLITYGLTVRPNYIDNGYSLVSARELRNGNINFSNAPQISSLDFLSLSAKCKPNKGDILFSKTGSIGLSAIVSSDREFALTQNVARIKFNNDYYDLIFIFSLLNQKAFIDKCVTLIKGNAVKDLQLGDFSNILIICPPKEIQKEFSNRLINLNLQIQQSQEISKNSSELFNSLLLKAFNGELVA